MVHLTSRTRRQLGRLNRRRVKINRTPTVVRSAVPFRFDACFRIGGAGEWHEEITRLTGISPSYSHMKGELKHGRKGSVWEEDIWMLESPLGVAEPIEKHLEWLWGALSPHKEYFNKTISKSAWADICIGCLSESAYPIFTATPQALSAVRELNVGFTFNFTCM